MRIRKITFGYVEQTFDTTLRRFISQSFVPTIDERQYIEIGVGPIFSNPRATMNGPDGKEMSLPYEMVQPPPRYTVGPVGMQEEDIRGKAVGVVLVSEDVGGIYAYIFEESRSIADQIMGALNNVDVPAHYEPENPYHYVLDFDADHAEAFEKSLKAREFDLFLRNGMVIGYTIRNNPATDRMLHILNGDPVDRFPLGWATMDDEQRTAAIGRTTFGVKRDAPPPLPGEFPAEDADLNALVELARKNGQSPSDLRAIFESAIDGEEHNLYSDDITNTDIIRILLEQGEDASWIRECLEG
jgi:hypothetical protein